MEAAGVEPASEKARNEENYVRSTIRQLQLPPQNRQEWRPPSPIDLGLMLRTEALQPIPLYDAHSPPRGLDGWSGYLIKLGGVCELCVGSSVFPIVLRELGTRHASPPRFNPVESVAPPLVEESQTANREIRD